MNNVRQVEPSVPPDRRAPERPAVAPPQRLCDLCRAPVVELHCKILCLNCGYQRDCSDP